MKPDHLPEFQLVDRPSLVEKMIPRLESQTAVAVDLEADSMYHYREKVCLLQLGTEGECFIVDTLKVKDLSALNGLFANPAIEKIFHGADYDVRSLYRDFRIRICNLFDTQIASRFLGRKETGLNAVLANRFHVQLDKKFQKKDWTQRPLPADMLSYAAGDVVFLVPLASMLKRELKDLGRLDWVMDECSLLSRVRPAAIKNEPFFLRFKGAGRLSPGDLTLLESILKLRDTLAEEKDRPPFKIFSNTSIAKMVRQKPLDITGLKKTNALSVMQLHRYGDRLIQSILGALKTPEAGLAVYPRKHRPVLKAAARKRVKVLREWRDRTAEQLKLEPALICPRSVITEIARQNPRDVIQLGKITELKNWQKNILGKEMLAVLKKSDGD